VAGVIEAAVAAGDEDRPIEVPLNAQRTADEEAARRAGEWQVDGEAATAAGGEDGHIDVPLNAQRTADLEAARWAGVW
jgi:hypothetical protein